MNPDTQLLEIVHQSGHLQKFILGAGVKQFEDSLRDRLGARDAVAVASGAGALAMALAAIGITVGDEVVVPAFCSSAVAAAVVNAGATPVFVDVDARTMVMDPCRIEEKITPRTRAVIPVHLFSCMADMTAILEIARRHALMVIEDAGSQLGARTGGTPAGLWGDIGAFSFSPATLMGACGEGGMVVTRHPELGVRCRMLRNHGQEEGFRFIHKCIGVNSRMDEIQALYLIQKLDELDSILAGRIYIAESYHRMLEPLEDHLILPPRGSDGRCYHQFVLQTAERDSLHAHLGRRGIRSRVYYPISLPHQETLAPYVQYGDHFENADRASYQNLALPMSTGMTDAQIRTVTDAVVEYFHS
jgi:dTDP-4-amino-4,6-dideoxygalactose transaminase